MPNSSFYADGVPYTEGALGVGNVPSEGVDALNSPKAANSSFYPDGTVYEALNNSDAVVAEMIALEAAAHTDANNAATSAVSSAASALSSSNSATTSTTEAGIATAQALIATTQAANSATSATASAASALLSTNQATIATTQATNAANSATTATTEAGIATTQAGTATTQAGISTTQAAASLLSATNAHTSEVNAAASAAAASGVLVSALLKANNLSDLANKATAKINLALVKADVGLGNVDNTSDVNKPVSTAAATAITAVATNATAADAVVASNAAAATALKANIASPTFTGVPAGPTASLGTNTTQFATTAFVLANASVSSKQIVAGLGLNPTSTTSTTPVMMGLGTTLKITPTSSTRVKITLSFTVVSDKANGQVRFNLRQGTGTAPANAAAASGTAISSIQTFLAAVANQTGVLACSVVVTGLTVGTAYWFDMAVNAANVSGAGAFVQQVDYIVEEI